MQNDVKVSVTMITYNGVNYIEEQLTSIFEQTRKPDEVIISDDGSTDGSIELMNHIIDDYLDSGVKISLLTDNPNHGIGPNFSWAVQHTTGDVIFVSGQDDIWAKDKIEKVLDVYNNHLDAQVVATDRFLIDSNGKAYIKNYQHMFIDKSGLKNGDIVKLHREEYIALVETVTLIAGPVLSFKRDIIDYVIPLPANIYEDQWIEFVGVAEDSIYYLNEQTTYYRVHDSVSNSANVSLMRRIQRTLKRIKIAYKAPLHSCCFENAILKYFNDCNIEDFKGRQNAIDTANMVIDLENTVIRFMRMNSIKGAFCLIKLFVKDTRYRKSGFQSFVVCLLYTVFYSKKRRNNEINTELQKCN